MPAFTRGFTAAALLLCAGPVPAAMAQVRAVADPYPYPEPAWSPYLVGALIGVLVLLTLMIARKPLGASSAYADTAGLIGQAIAPRHIASLKYYQDHKPKFGWTMVFVCGSVGGGLLAAWSGGGWTGTYLQDLWVARFGSDSHGLRTALALAGGMAIAYGARMAGGCTSGHGISGALQLAVSSWIAVICFFIGGIVTAMLLYRM
jgi:hypothetical protein